MIGLASPALPHSVARCDPIHDCPQRRGCARFLAEGDDDTPQIDASTALARNGCALFLDVRGVELLSEAS